MNEFLENLKRQAEANPLQALGVAAAAILAMSKLIDAGGHARGSHAYARQVAHRIKASKR